MEFVGRKKELGDLELLTGKNSASLVIIRGRRRIGKSRLIKEFCSKKKSWTFSGIPPTKGVTNQEQLDIFSRQISENLELPQIRTSDWMDNFIFLANQAKRGKIVILFDEISWMGSKDPNFLGLLKTAWDMHFSSNPKLILILCGSASWWIEKNILKSTGFVGRVSLDMILEELSITESSQFWGREKNRVSSYEKFKMLSVTGGVPRYLEEIIPTDPAENNIQRLCFQKEGLLFKEFDQIFSDLFSRRASNYGKIIKTLSHAPLTFSEICKKLNLGTGGNLSEYLADLVLAGFIQEDYTWNISKKKDSRLKKFRLKDNYLRFYLRYIEPNRGRILKNVFNSGSFMLLPGWKTVMGLQFENLVLSNPKTLFKRLRIDTSEVFNFGPFFQNGTKRQKGCQIDLMIQTVQRTLYLCEIKFNTSEVRGGVIKEMEKRIERLSIPKGFSLRPVLIHVNGVSQSVKESELFNDIVDFSSLFEM